MSMPEQLKPVTPDAPALGITHSASLAHTSLPPRSFRMAFTRPVLIRESHSKSLRTIEPQNITRSKRISGYFSIAPAAMYVWYGIGLIVASVFGIRIQQESVVSEAGQTLAGIPEPLPRVNGQGYHCDLIVTERYAPRYGVLVSVVYAPGASSPTRKDRLSRAQLEPDPRGLSSSSGKCSFRSGRVL